MLAVATFKRRQVTQPSVEQLGLGELRGRGEDLQDRTMLVAITGGTISTRRDVFGNGNVGGAVARSREDAEMTETERIHGEAGELRERQADTAQREQLPDDVWLAMSQTERKRYRRLRK